MTTQHFQRKPTRVLAWRYTDPNQRDNLPQWIVDAINDWDPQLRYGIHFTDRGPIELYCYHASTTLKLCPVGFWIVKEGDGKFDSFSDQEFRELYEPAPITLPNVSPTIKELVDANTESSTHQQ